MSDLDETEFPLFRTRNVVWVLLALLGLFVLYGAIVWKVAGQDRAGFGDMFGAISAFASAVAMFGILATIYLQRKELQLQRQELKESRRELARSAKAQEESHRVLRNTMFAQTFSVVFNILQDKETRGARRIILDQYPSHNFGEPGGLTTEVRDAAEKVCTTYDSVGLLIRHGLIPAGHVAFPYGDSLRRCWRILRPLVERYRRDRGSPEIWTGFEELAASAGASDARPRSVGEGAEGRSVR
jgi:hypothetical protein